MTVAFPEVGIGSLDAFDDDALFPSLFFDNCLLSFDGPNVTNIVPDGDRALIVKYPKTLFIPNDAIIELVRADSYELPAPTPWPAKNRRRSKNKSFRFSTMSLDEVFNDPDFIPVPFWKNVLVKAGRDFSTAVAITKRACMAVDLPCGLFKCKVLKVVVSFIALYFDCYCCTDLMPLT